MPSRRVTLAVLDCWDNNDDGGGDDGDDDGELLFALELDNAVEEVTLLMPGWRLIGALPKLNAVTWCRRRVRSRRNIYNAHLLMPPPPTEDEAEEECLSIVDSTKSKPLSIASAWMPALLL